MSDLTPEQLDELSIDRLRRRGYVVIKENDICVGLTEGDRIINAVARRYGLRPQDLAGRGRTSVLAEARQVAMYIARVTTRLTLAEIGQLFGGRNHGTVHWAVKVTEGRIKRDPAIAKATLDIRNGLR